ncbi:MAG: hypothetical protein OQJ97_02460 [Rhodospirillales bacterium]|nr:hypothetical protein [Rhodospirillales bacterium]
MKSLIVATLFALFAIFPVQAEEKVEVLNKEQIIALLSGKTLVGETQLQRFADLKDKTFYVYLHQDGSLKILNFLGKTDTGKWEVNEDGTYCNQYDHTRVGKQACYRVEKAKDHYRLYDTRRQSVSTLFKTEDGNFKGL